jgi:hypothetical protein
MKVALTEVNALIADDRFLLLQASSEKRRKPYAKNERF